MSEKLKKLGVKAMEKHAVKNADEAYDYKERLVTLRNKFIRASYRLTLNEKRLIYLAISQINPQLEKGKVRPDYKVYINDVMHTFNLTSKDTYKQIAEAADRLFDREYRVKYVAKNGKEEYRRIRWVDEAAYQPSDGWVQIVFGHTTLQMLEAIRGNFTSYKLKEVQHFKSKYTWAMFELFAQYRKSKTDFSGVIMIKSDDLREVLDAPDTYSTGMFHKRCLNTSLNEIANIHNLEIHMSIKKKGKKISSYVIAFEPKEQQNLDLK